MPPYPLTCMHKVKIFHIGTSIHRSTLPKYRILLHGLKRWRKHQAEVLALAEVNSSDKDEASVLVGASVVPSVHERGDY